MELHLILALIWLHFFADFVLQPRNIAIKKSFCNIALGMHVLIYTVAFIPFGFLYALVNGLAHFITDYISSRLTTYYWKEEDHQKFWIVIGLDQTLHFTALFGIYYWMYV